jgi:hypothetical protein
MWPDNETDIDLLGFDFLVDGLVIALSEPRLLPLTVGVLGDWGSGKSSLMGLALPNWAPRHRQTIATCACGSAHGSTRTTRM